MGKTRSELREKAMVILYQLDILKNNGIDYNIENVISDNLDIDSEFVRNVVYGVVTHLDELDENIELDKNNPISIAIYSTAFGQTMEEVLAYLASKEQTK